MDNYNQMINNDYNNMVYSGANEQVPSQQPQHHQIDPDETMMLTGDGTDKVPVDQYHQQRESIITNIPPPHQMDVYQQHELQPHDALLIQNHQAQLQQTSVIQTPMEYSTPATDNNGPFFFVT